VYCNNNVCYIKGMKTNNDDYELKYETDEVGKMVLEVLYNNPKGLFEREVKGKNVSYLEH